MMSECFYLQSIGELKVSVAGNDNWLSVDMFNDVAITLFSYVQQINRVPQTLGLCTVTLACPRLHWKSLWTGVSAVYTDDNLTNKISN